MLARPDRLSHPVLNEIFLVVGHQKREERTMDESIKLSIVWTKFSDHNDHM
jgi:hypothetical protein